MKSKSLFLKNKSQFSTSIVNSDRLISQRIHLTDIQTPDIDHREFLTSVLLERPNQMLYFGLPFTERPHSYCYLDRSHVHCIISFPFSHFKYLDRYKSKPAKYCRQFIPNHNYCYTVSISLDFYTREPAHTPLTTLMSFDPRLPDCSL